MLRLLLLAVLVVLLVRFLVRLALVLATALREGATPPATASPEAAPVALVPCRRCGVFVPREAARPTRTAEGDGFLCRSCAGT
jgi:hypothetical protein